MVVFESKRKLRCVIAASEVFNKQFKCSIQLLEIEITEFEMTGLLSCRKDYLNTIFNCSCARITESCPYRVTAVLIETLKARANVRWCSCHIFSTHDHAAAAAIARDGTGSAAVFAWKTEYWECTFNAVTWPVDAEGDGPDLLVDDGVDVTMTLLIHEGVKYEKLGVPPSPSPDETDFDAKLKYVCAIIALAMKTNPKKWQECTARLVGVSEEPTTGVYRLYNIVTADELLFVAIGAGAGAAVFVPDGGPTCTLQASMAGLHMVQIRTSSANKDSLLLGGMAKMKNTVVVGNIDHFDIELDLAGLMAATTRQNTKPQLDSRCATNHPSSVMSYCSTNQTLAQTELWENRAIYL